MAIEHSFTLPIFGEQVDKELAAFSLKHA